MPDRLRRLIRAHRRLVSLASGLARTGLVQIARLRARALEIAARLQAGPLAQARSRWATLCEDGSAALYLAIALFAGAAGLVGYLFVPEAQAHASVHPEVRLAGEPVSADEDPRARALRAARAYLRGTLELTVGSLKFQTTRAALGVRVDLPALETMLRAAHDQASPLRRLHVQERGDLPIQIGQQMDVYLQAAEPPKGYSFDSGPDA